MKHPLALATAQIVHVLCLAALTLSLAGCAAPKYETITEEHAALAARAEKAIATAGDSPGREYANRLRTDQSIKWLQQLRGETPAKKGSLGWPMRSIAQCCEKAEAGPDWPRPPAAKVPRLAGGGIKIDGRLDEAAWQTALTYTDIYKFNEPARLQQPGTTWKVLWDQDNLYFAFDCEDDDIVAPVYERDDAVYSDDCVEMFILPDFRFRTYWEIIISPSRSVYDSVQCKDTMKWGTQHDPTQTIEGLDIGLTVRGTLNQTNDVDEGYTVEVAVPFNQLPGYTRTGPKVGDKLNFMLARLDRRHGLFTPYAYEPLLGWGHNIWNHAALELVEAKQEESE